jgi:protein-S-isoprenylcysteine O-methyltransferase Ste14
MKTGLRAAVSSLVGLVLFGVMLFLPAGTFDYWQGWLFLAVFSVSTWIPTIYLLRKNPAALERRMRAGPIAEPRMVQKVIISATIFLLAAMIVISVLDHRFGWSHVPAAVSLIGDVVVAIGLGIAMVVVIQNSYAAANISVEANQTLVSTGLYGLVRHPMYAGSIILLMGIPLALGSYWGLIALIPGLIVLIVRILDEEQVLEQQLAGYREYEQQVHYRLIPYVW